MTLVFLLPSGGESAASQRDSTGSPLSSVELSTAHTEASVADSSEVTLAQTTQTAIGKLFPSLLMHFSVVANARFVGAVCKISHQSDISVKTAYSIRTVKSLWSHGASCKPIHCLHT